MSAIYLRVSCNLLAVDTFITLDKKNNMTVKCFISAFLLTLILSGCTKEYDCTDLVIQPAFIGFASSDIDTFVLRKFKPNDNYQNLIDTFIVKFGDYSVYRPSNDTTTVFVSDAGNDGKVGIKAGYDWQIFIPSINKTVFVSDIISEKTTGKYSWGIFSLDKFANNCANRIFSAKMGNQIINFSDSAGYYLFIRN
jgi:hypothetical protein